MYWGHTTPGHLGQIHTHTYTYIHIHTHTYIKISFLRIFESNATWVAPGHMGHNQHPEVPCDQGRRWCYYQVSKDKGKGEEDAKGDLMRFAKSAINIGLDAMCRLRK